MSFQIKIDDKEVIAGDEDVNFPTRDEKMKVICLCKSDGAMMTYDPAFDAFVCPKCGNRLRLPKSETINIS
jgi:predicted RNA-binding Zn-ribbon protein involved in translation (DUF1610 family)